MEQLVLHKKTIRMKEERITALEAENALLHLQIAELNQSFKLIIKHSVENSVGFRCQDNYTIRSQLPQLRQQSQELRQDMDKLQLQYIEYQQKMQSSFQTLSTVLHNILYKHSYELDGIKQRYEEEKAKRKELHNELVELRGNIRVNCRVRPLLQTDLDKECASCMKCVDDETIQVSHSQGSYLGSRICERHFFFDRVHGPSDSQAEIFAEVKLLITSLLDGYNVCIMAYGQTGSGKTHTMLGNEDQLGVLPLAAAELFRIIQERESDWEVTATVVEIYNEQIRDLLSQKPKISYHDVVIEHSGEVEISNITERLVSSESELLSLISEGTRNRATHSTSIHEHSSRSHLIVTVHITGPSEDGGSSVSSANSVSSLQLNATITPVSSTDTTPTVSPDNSPRSRCMKSYLHQSKSAIQVSSSASMMSPVDNRCSSPMYTHHSKFHVKLQLVDLAGSECVGESGVEGTSLKEAQHINRSLCSLSDVLGALAEKRPHIPYRNSVLTHVLQDSIGGSAKMLMFLCVSPTSQQVGESLRALRFGERARQVQRPPPPAKRTPRMHAHHTNEIH